MAKIISYKFLSCEVNHGTEEQPDIEQIIFDKSMACSTQEIFDINYPIAEKEAIPNTIEVIGEFDPIPDAPSTSALVSWEELDMAYIEGVNSL